LASAKEIPPGGEGKIKVTFHTERRCGINRHRVTVESNDPESPSIPLEVVADLYIALAVSPARHTLDQIKPNETVTRTFVFEGEMLEQAEITGIRLKEDVPYPDAFTWLLNDSVNGGIRDLSLDVSVNAALIPPGRFAAALVVSTNIDMPDLELRLIGDILKHIDAKPPRLYLRHMEITCDTENQILFKSNTGIPFRILDASIEDPDFKIDPWNSEAGLEHRITFRYCPDAPRDRFLTKLVITTDLDTHREVDVDIHAYQRSFTPGTDRN
jgi:hypothetical protein